MSHKSVFRAKVTNVAFILPDPSDELLGEVSAPVGEATLSIEARELSSVEGGAGDLASGILLLLSFIPFHLSKPVTSDNGGFGIVEDEVMK